MAKRGENIYQRKDGRWEGKYIRGRVEGRIRYGYLTGNSYEEGLRRKQDKLREMEKVGSSVPSNPLLVSAVSERWVESRRGILKETTLGKYDSVLKNYILPQYGGRRIDSISEDEVRLWLEGLRFPDNPDVCGISAKSANGVASVLRLVLQYARTYCNIPAPELLDVCKKSERYRALFTKEYLMGPNSMRLLEEMLEKYPLQEGCRVMDLGCGKGITSLYLAKEVRAKVYATDLWISATENARMFERFGISETAIPIHANANDLPYAQEYFDAIVSIDSFHYFATEENYFREKILPFLKTGGVAVIAMPGLKEEFYGEAPELMMEWVDGDQGELDLFHSREWWLNRLAGGEDFEIIMDFDMDCLEEAWRDWFATRHEFAIRDEEFFERGIGKYLSFVGLVIRRTGA